MEKENQEEKPPKMFAYGIFKVIYSPTEAFKNITKKPNIKGPLLILLLVSICYVGRAYISSSKVLYQKNGLDVSSIQTEMAGLLITNFIIDAFFVFILKWGIHAAVFIMVLMVFRLGKISWKELFIALGYTFSVAIIYYGLSVPLTMTLPLVYTNMSLQDVNQTKVTQLVWEKWSPEPASYAINYLSIVTYAWTAILSCIAMRFLYDFNWKKAGMITALASFMNFFLTIYFRVFP